MFLELQKGENLYALGAGTKAEMKLKGVARYISHSGSVDKLPLVVSDKGYGIVMASSNAVLCCDIPTYGTQICADGETQLDYYFIAGEKITDILSAYDYLCKDKN